MIEDTKTASLCNFTNVKYGKEKSRGTETSYQYTAKGKKNRSAIIQEQRNFVVHRNMSYCVQVIEMDKFCVYK